MSRLVNFVPESILCARAVRRRARWWGVWGGVGAPLVCGVALAYVAASVEPTGALAARLSEAQARLDELEGSIGEVESRIVERSGRLALQRRITDTPRWSPLFEMLAARVSDRAALDRIALTRDDSSRSDAVRVRRLVLTGRTDSTQTLSAMLLDLEGERVFSSVDLVSSRSREASAAGGGGGIAFEIVCEIGGGAGGGGAGGGG